MKSGNVIVITDDSRGDRYLLKKALDTIIEPPEYVDYREADSGEGVIQTLVRMKDNEEYPHLLILDFILGDTNGLNVVRQLQGNYPPFPIVVLSGGSGCDNFDEVAPLFRAGVNAFMYKPNTLVGYIDMMRAMKLLWLDQPKANWAKRPVSPQVSLFNRRNQG